MQCDRWVVERLGEMAPTAIGGGLSVARCDSYFQHGLTYRCYATKGYFECFCCGDQSKCDFFPERREPKVQDPLEQLKKQLVESCKEKLDYYDVVNEGAEMVEYGMIIDFLFERIAGMMMGR